MKYVRLGEEHFSLEQSENGVVILDLEVENEYLASLLAHQRCPAKDLSNALRVANQEGLSLSEVVEYISHPTSIMAANIHPLSLVSLSYRDEGDRATAAAHRKAPFWLLESLLLDESFLVVANALINPNLSHSVRENALKQQGDEVLLIYIQNTHDNDYLRSLEQNDINLPLIASNPRIDGELLHEIVVKHCDKIAFTALHNSQLLDKTLSYAARNGSMMAIWDAASHPRLPKKDITHIIDSTDDDTTIRKIAARKDLTQAQMRKLLSYFSPSVHYDLVNNPKTPKAILIRMAKFNDESLRDLSLLTPIDHGHLKTSKDVVIAARQRLKNMEKEGLEAEL